MARFKWDYLVLPRHIANVLLDGTIKMMDLRVYAVVYADGDECQMSNAALAATLNTNQSQIAKSLSRLHAAGFVVRKSFDGRVRTMKAV